MPYRKTKKAPRRKYGRRKYKRRMGRMVRAPRMGTGIAPAVFAKLKYVETYSGNTGSAPYQVNYRGNSLFDPNVAIGGHQPLYFDQYMALYGKYLVLGSSMKLTVTNGSNTAALQCVLWPNTDVTVLATVSEVLEQTKASTMRTIPLGQSLAYSTKRYAKTSTVLGLSKVQLGEEELSGTSSANPANEWFWSILFSSIDGSSTVSVAYCVEITYYVKFYDRLFQNQS